MHKYFFENFTCGSDKVTIDRVWLYESKGMLTADKEAVLAKVRNCSFAVTIFTNEKYTTILQTCKEMQEAIGLYRNIAIYYPYCKYNSIIAQIENKYNNM